MKVDAKTRYKDFEPFVAALQDGEDKRLQDAAARHYIGEGGFWDLTIRQYIELTEGESDIKADLESVYGVYFVAGLSVFLQEFVDKIEALKIEPTEKEQRAMAGCLQVSLAESMLVFTRRYFGLHNFTDAEGITLGDYYIARRDDYNAQIYQRTRAAIDLAEMKNKR